MSPRGPGRAGPAGLLRGGPGSSGDRLLELRDEVGVALHDPAPRQAQLWLGAELEVEDAQRARRGQPGRGDPVLESPSGRGQALVRAAVDDGRDALGREASHGDAVGRLEGTAQRHEHLDQRPRPVAARRHDRARRARRPAAAVADVRLELVEGRPDVTA